MSAIAMNDENQRPNEATGAPRDCDRQRFGFRKKAGVLRPQGSEACLISPLREATTPIPVSPSTPALRPTPPPTWPSTSRRTSPTREVMDVLSLSMPACVPVLPSGGASARLAGVAPLESVYDFAATVSGATSGRAFTEGRAPCRPASDIDLVAIVDEELGDLEAVSSVLKLKPRAGRFDFKDQIAELKGVVGPLKDALGERLRREVALREAAGLAQAQVDQRLSSIDARLAEQRRALEDRLDHLVQQHALEMRALQAKEVEAERARVETELLQERAFAERTRVNQETHARALADLEEQLQSVREDCRRQVEEASALLQSQIVESNRVTKDMQLLAKACEDRLVAEWSAKLEQARQESEQREDALRKEVSAVVDKAQRREVELTEEHAAALGAAGSEARSREEQLLRQLDTEAAAARDRLEELRSALQSEVDTERARAEQREVELQREMARKEAEAGQREQSRDAEHAAALRDLEASMSQRQRDAVTSVTEVLGRREAQLKELERKAQEREREVVSEAAERISQHIARIKELEAKALERERAAAAEGAERLRQAEALAQERLRAVETEAAQKLHQRDAQLQELETKAHTRECELLAEAAESRNSHTAQLRAVENRAQQKERELAAESAERISHYSSQLGELEARSQQREREMAADAAERLSQSELRARQREHELSLRLEQQVFRTQQTADELRLELDAAQVSAKSREEDLRAELKEAVSRSRQLAGELAAAQDRFDSRERRFQDDLDAARASARKLEGDLAAERSARDRETLAKTTLQGEHATLLDVVEQTRCTLQKLQAQYVAVQERNAELQRELLASEAETDRLREAVAEEQAALQKRQELLEGLGVQLASVREELAADKAEVSTLREKSRRLSVDKRELELEYRSYKEHNSTSNAAQMQAITELKVTVDKLSQKVEATQSELLVKCGDVALHQGNVRKLEEQLALAETSRRELHNTIQELRGNIRVFCRIRPGLGNEPTALLHAEDGKLSLGHGGESYTFSFDRVFGPSCVQEDLFQEVSGLVQSALDGYKVCIFAYGQTGTGKTYTMQGGEAPHTWGLIPRSLRQIFTAAEQMRYKGWQWSLKASFMEVYNEVLRDLLREEEKSGSRGSAGGASTPQCHTIKHDADWGTIVTNMTCVQVSSMDQINSLMAKAARLRAVGSTDMNSVSSRSHSVFALYLSGSNTELNQELRGALHLVDLAGSERLDRSGSVGDRLKETQNINRSLSSLVDVFAAKAEGRSHVPFRNSKLTHLMEPCLSGQGKTLMAVNIGPEAGSSHETLCSLRFASQVSQCTTGGKPRRSAKTVTRTATSASLHAATATRHGGA